jgi:hypothetical protein
LQLTALFLEAPQKRNFVPSRGLVLSDTTFSLVQCAVNVSRGETIELRQFVEKDLALLFETRNQSAVADFR